MHDEQEGGEQMKRYFVEAYRPHVYMVKADNRRQAVQKAVARWQRAHHTVKRAPKVAVVTEASVGLSYWDSVDAAIDDYKERTL
jgi:hypothetical protein